MRKAIVVLIVIFFPSFVFAQPVIHFSEESHDFGTVRGDRSLEYDFEFLNAGTEELVIKKVSPP